MKCFVFLCLLLSFGESGKVIVQVPSVEQETDYVWRTLQDLAFFDQYGYDIALPEGILIESLKNKSKENDLDDEDYQSLYTFMKEEVYEKSDYEEGFEKAANNIPLLESFLDKIHKSERNWDFKFFETYVVTLTLYGPGGSYNPDEGSIILYTTKEGAFKQYDDPVNTIIHEIVHIGMEKSIMQQYNVSHGLKERIVDTFVHLNFKDQLPDYRIQNMGDIRLDSLLSDKEDLNRLEEIVQALLKENH